jgi:inosine/xanthosine triphosphate pyrophosphatase family protein
VYYDPDFYRQCHRERVEAMRMEYQRAQARHRSKAFARFKRYVQFAFSRARSPRRAPAFRA